MANKNGSGTPPTQEQLDITNAMSKAMQSMLVEAKRLEASFISQAAAIKQMCDAMECLRSPDAVNNLRQIKSSLDQIAQSAEGVRGVGSALEDAAASAEEATSSTERLRNALNDTRKGSDKLGTATSKLAKLFRSGLGKAGTFAAGALKGMANGLKLLFNVGRAAFGVLGTLAKGIFSIGRALLAIPITIFKKLTEMANKGATGISEWAQALNELKKEFGFLSDPTNSAILASASNVDKVYGKQAAFKLFGTPAERVKELAEIMKSAGPNLKSFSDDIVAGNVELLGLSRGLGIGGADFEAFALRARTSGQELGDTMTNVAKYSLMMSKRFKLDMKGIARDMGKAAQDMTHFGNISEKQIGIAVTYAQKLGIQLDKITGSFDKFSTFDDAAENISKINEAFGTNLDIGEIMMEQDPAAQFEMIRKGLMGAGIQGEKMTFAQRKLLESTTGWDSATSIAALSTKNAGIALKDFQKEADKAEKKTMTHVEALNALTGAMHQNLKAGNPTPGKGFFDKFLEGMKFALETHPAFIRLMQAFRKGFVDARASGISFGTFLINNIPGVVKMMDGLAAMVEKIGFLFNGVTGAFKKFITNVNSNMGKFMQDIAQNPKAAFEQLGADLRKVFEDFFNVQAPGARKLGEGFKDFMRFIIAILAGALPYMMDTLASMISKLADFIANPDAFMAAAKQKALAGAKAGGGILAPLVVAITGAWPTLANALDKLGKTIFEKLEKLFNEYEPKIKKFFSDLLDEAIAKLKEGFGKADFGSLFGIFSTVAGSGGGIALFIAGLKMIGSTIQAIKIAKLTKDVANLTNILSGAAPAAGQAAEKVGLLAQVGPKLAAGWASLQAMFSGGLIAGFTSLGVAIKTAVVGAVAAVPPFLAVAAAIVAVAAAIYQAYQLYKDLKQQDVDLSDAKKDVEGIAKQYGVQGLRNKLGVDKQGKVQLTDDELKTMYEQRVGTVVFWTDSKRQKITKLLEDEFQANLAIAKEADKKEQDLGKQVKEASKQKEIEVAEKKEDEKRYKDFMKAIGADSGAINAATFKEKIAEIDRTAKEITKGTAELQKNFETIRTELAKIDFGKMFGENAETAAAKKKELKNVVKSLLNLKAFLILTGQIVTEANAAAGQISSFGDSEKTDSVAGKVATLAKQQRQTISKIIEAFASSEGQSIAPKDALAKMKESTKDVFNIVETATKTLQNMTSLSASLKTVASEEYKVDPTAEEKIRTNIESLGTSASNLFATVQTTFSGIGVSFDLDPLANDITKIKDNIEKIKNSYNAMGQVVTALDGTVPAALQTFGKTLSDIPNTVGTIVAVNIEPAITAVENIMTAARKLTTALEQGGTIDIDASLRKYAGSAFSAKGGAKYTVTAKEVVLNVNFSVKMDADEIQGVMAKKGVFREKINYILDALPDANEGAREAAPNMRL